MRRNYFLLLASVFLASAFLACCDAVNFGEARLSRMGTSGFIQASDAQQSSPTENRFLRTIKTVDEKAGNSEDEERGLLNALKKLKLRSKLYTDGGIRRSRKTFNDWYRSGLTPDDVWNSLKPIVNGGYDPKYQTYLNYKKFYDIKKALSRKKA